MYKSSTFTVIIDMVEFISAILPFLLFASCFFICPSVFPLLPSFVLNIFSDVSFNFFDIVPLLYI